MKDLTAARRLGVAALAVATLGAGVPALLATAAGAATERLIISPTSQSASAGTCAVFTITPLTNAGNQSTDADTITVRIDEGDAASDTQDVDFCVVPGVTSSPGGGARYDNGNLDLFPVPQPADRPLESTYTPGPSITNSSRNAGGTPDEAAGTEQTTPNAPRTNTNPSGQDFARYGYSGQAIRIGVVGLTPGRADVLAFRDSDNDFVVDAGEVRSSEATLALTAGGVPGSAEAVAAVATLDAEPEDDAAVQGTQQAFTAVLRNAAGDTVAGVTPLVRVVSGPNVAAVDQVRADCGPSDNSGIARCVFQGTKPGTDTLTIFVQRTGGTAGPDANEAQDTVTRTTTPPANQNPAQARFVDLLPESASTAAGSSRTFTAVVTDRSGVPVQGVQVTFTESGVGSFPNGQSTVTGTTGSTGRASVVVETVAGQTGDQVIIASIPGAGTDCDEPAGSPAGAAAGRCTDSATHTVTAGSPSPSPSASRSASPSASASSSASASPSRSATASASGTATPSPQLSLRVTSPSTITPGQGSVLRAVGQAGSVVVLRCYSRPSTDYFDARTAPIGSNGEIEFRLNPGTNTRCFVKYSGSSDSDPRNSPSVVQNVATALSLTVVRNGTRDYTFQGRILPRRSGQLITLYRVESSGREVLTSQVRTDSTGTWRIRRVFTGGGRFDFIARTGQNLTNVAGRSNVRPTAIF